MEDDILRMAREAGFLPNANPVMPQLLARFADLVRADERERIKAKNAAEIDKINAYLKEMDDAITALLAKSKE